MIQGDILCPCSIYRGIIMPLYHLQGHNFYPPVAYTKMGKDFKTTNSHPPTHSSSLISTISEENVQKNYFCYFKATLAHNLWQGSSCKLPILAVQKISQRKPKEFFL